MNVELHLPDLPDVPVSLGAEPGQPRRPQVAWSERLRMGLGTYLPLLLMVALALVTWWLVKMAPKVSAPAAAVALRHEADYTLDRFALQRFDAKGQLAALIEGERLRHYPDTDEIEIDRVSLTLTAPDGRQTHATARHAVAAGDGSVVRLEGDARVTSLGLGDGEPVEMRGQRLEARVRDQQLSTDQPVQVRQGHTELSADALDYDHRSGQLALHGKVRGVWQPRQVKR